MESNTRDTGELLRELEETRRQLQEAQDTVEAIRTGGVDALIVQNGHQHQLYTLQSADHAYRIFIEKMTEGAVTLNQEGVISYANSQFAAMIELPLSYVLGLPFRQFISERSLTTYDILFPRCLEADCKAEVELCSKTECKSVLLSFAPLGLADGISLSIIVTDLTAQKSIQKQLEQSNQRLGHLNEDLEASNHDLQQFASIASHDLQEPLRKIQVFSNLLKEHNSNLSERSQLYLEKIIDSSTRMRTLIIDILTFSKLSANDESREMIDLNKMMKELTEDFELIMAEKKATIIVENMPEIKGNKGQIRQVFQNIVSNALKFAKPEISPVIEIKAKIVGEKSFTAREKRNGKFCFISIKDNGIGFENKYVDNIFALFERLNSKDKYEGTGIGLAIAKKIVEKHDGIITAKSKEGKGAEFQMIIPINQPYINQV